MTKARRLRDKNEIRRRLNCDRDWSLYALADLDDGMFEQTDWWGFGDGLALVFNGLSIRPIFVIANSQETPELLAAVGAGSGYLNLRPEQMPAADGIYAYRERHEMWRMIIDRKIEMRGDAVPITKSDSEDVQKLYSSGDGGGIAFAPFQLETGFFRGVRRNGELVAVAGVHVVSQNESVAGLGNVFTRPDCRGHGLAHTVTAAVVAALQAEGIRTIGLNVEHTNHPAIRVYQRLGFRPCIRYYEGIAVRLPAATGDER